MNRQKILLNIALYTVLAITFSAIVHFSKKYFETNYNKHSTVESNIGLYKVPSNEDSTEQTLLQPKVIEVNTVDVHPEPTAIIVDEMIPDVIPPADIIETPKVKEASNISPKEAPQPLVKKPETKKIIKKDNISKPKTLTKAEPIAKSVLNNPLFRTFVIQTGAFKNTQDANTHRIRIQQLKIINNYTIEVIKSGELHKVVIGYFENSNTAKDLCTQLKKENVQCFATRI
ncbi:MAG: SPOR domain-containing protein [Proteobacteria bacterium]|nr:SPOR domain-containing protein [Pseudomonadota bacterium]